MNNNNNSNDKDLKKYYEILEIDSDASTEDIIRAYNYLKSLYSSDSAATLSIDDEWDETDKQEILEQVEEAYTKLMATAQKEEEPFELKEADMTTAGDQQPESIEFDDEEISEESIKVELPPTENLVEIEIPSEEDDQEEGVPLENLEEEETPEESFDLDDTLAEVIIQEEPIEGSIEEPVEESKKEPMDISIEEPIEGMVLRKIRKKQGHTIQELSDSTQIPKKIVEYMEREEYNKLPDAGYLRWYITNYAKALSLDPKDTADQYMKRYRQWKIEQDSQE